MNQIKITFRNRTFNAKYWQWFYFLILDINDFLGRPFLFDIISGNTFKNFTFDLSKLREGSGKKELALFIRKAIFNIRMENLDSDDKSVERNNEI